MKNFWALTTLALLTTSCSAGIGCNFSFLGGCGEDTSGDYYNPYSPSNPFPTPSSAPSGTPMAWSTIDDFAYANTAAAQATASDASGNIYVAGWGFDAATTQHWIVRKFSAGSWITMDDYQYSPGRGAQATSVTSDSSGNIYVAGYAVDNVSLWHWIVRKFSGGTWTTSDDYRYPATPGDSTPTAIASDFSGNLYVAGYAADNSSVQHWLVRKFSGGAWSTIDDYNYIAGHGANATALTKDLSGNIYTAGFSTDVTNVPYWIVREYSGGTWTTIDVFQYTSGQSSRANAITSDAAGNIYVGGYGNDASTAQHWIVQKYSAGVWSTSDDFFYQNSTSSSPVAFSLSTDAAGNVYASGGALDNSSFWHWIVRKQSGGTWSIFDDYLYPASGMNNQTIANSITVAPNGSIYSAGIATASSSAPHWIVRSY
jgi:hypothetical protein